MAVMDNIELRLIQGEELAKMHGYSGVTSQCRAWWCSLGIEPVPGRKNIYDPRLVRNRLDQAGGLATAKLTNDSATVSLVDQRKARINAQR